MSALKPQEPITVNCPSCQKPTLWGMHNPWRPFCSERCRQLDLHAWAHDQYQIPTDSAAPTPTTDLDEPDA